MSKLSRSHTVTSETALFARQLLSRLADNPMALGAAGSTESTPLPPHIAALFQDILVKLAMGHPVTVAETKDEMTPNEAADFLNVSRPYVLKLLDEGTLPFRMVGTHRRIPVADLAAYKIAQRARSRAAMTELTRISEELGLYDDDGAMPPKSDYRQPPHRAE